MKTALAIRRPSWLSLRIISAMACLIIVSLGAFVRLLGTDWDEGANLHPDERHMMFVVTDAMAEFEKLTPGELSTGELWFAAGKSPLDPRRGDRLYVYGEFPHLVASVSTLVLGGGWTEILLRARIMGAVLDAYTILAVFLLAALLFANPLASLTAAAFYAFLPLAIQQSNFFTVDIWLTSASAWCLVAATRLVRAPGLRSAWLWVIVGGALSGLAVACKLPGVALIFAVWAAIFGWHLKRKADRRFGTLAAMLLVSLACAVVIFRLSSPFTFQGPGLFDVTPTANYIKGYVDMSNLVLDPGFPPNWQWIAANGMVDALRDLLFWAIGPAVTLALLAGSFHLARGGFFRWTDLAPTLAATAAFGLYWTAGPIPALRYILPALPAVCVLAAAAVPACSSTRLGRAAIAAVVLASVAWGSGMVALHTHTNPRIAASRWLWLTTPPGTVLANESSWDDGLPVPVRLPGSPDLRWGGQDDHFTYLTLHMEYPDSREKAHDIAEMLDQATLLIVSSERLRKPIMALSERFPMSAAYYAMLAAGTLCYEPVFQGRTGYPVLGMRLDDRSVQEPWSVYDHPKVEVYRRLPCYDRGTVEAKLIQALPPEP